MRVWVIFIVLLAIVLVALLAAPWARVTSGSDAGGIVVGEALPG
jgi:hypothetical protein